MAASRPTLSVVIPALNEERHVADAVRDVTFAIGERFADWELLLFDDGSTDRTGAIMDALAAVNPRVRVTHNPHPRNLGGVYKQGIALARFEYLLMVPGDNENPWHALIAPFDALGLADIVVPYNKGSNRGWFRNLVSRSYTTLVNALFGLRLAYYNGTVIHRTENLKNLTVQTDSFAYQTEILIKLLRAGKSRVEVPVRIESRAGRRTKAFRWKNLVGVARALWGLVEEVYFSPRATRARRGARVRLHAERRLTPGAGTPGALSGSTPTPPRPTRSSPRSPLPA
ncbi:MAG TPA: glycosyltransferase family 2 protein [Planctomycetota bacterium]|nr:glycosyltransferase family 2 protein [Planctomycetota bacterium]